MKVDHRLSIDRSKTLGQEPASGHNRWHPHLKPLIRVNEGDIVALETRDAFDGQIDEGSEIKDLLGLSLGRAAGDPLAPLLEVAASGTARSALVFTFSVGQLQV